MTSFLRASLVALAALGRPLPQAHEVPALEITASYLPGMSPEDPCWMVTLRDPGESSLKVCGVDPKAIQVSPRRFAALREAISNERVFELGKYYGDLPVDGPKRRMEIRLGGNVRRISVYSIKPKMPKREADEVDRAMKVWYAIQDCFQLPAKEISQ